MRLLRRSSVFASVKPTTISVAAWVSRPYAVSCPPALPEHSKIFQRCSGHPHARACSRHLATHGLEVGGLQVDGEPGAVRRDHRQPRRIDVERDHARAERRGDLHAVRADAADAHDDGEVAGLEPAADDRLVRRGDGVGDDGERRQVVAAAIAHDAQAARGDAHELGEAAVHVVAGHELAAAGVAAAGVRRAGSRRRE